MLSSCFCVLWKKFSLILYLNVLGFFADLKSDGRPFHIFGPRLYRHFRPQIVSQNGNFNLDLNFALFGFG